MAKPNNRWVVKVPIDIFKNLKREFPDCSNPERIKKIYESHIELLELKYKVNKMGKFIYGKSPWENRYGKK